MRLTGRTLTDISCWKYTVRVLPFPSIYFPPSNQKLVSTYAIIDDNKTKPVRSAIYQNLLLRCINLATVQTFCVSDFNYMTLCSDFTPVGIFDGAAGPAGGGIVQMISRREGKYSDRDCHAHWWRCQCVYGRRTKWMIKTTSFLTSYGDGGDVLGGKTEDRYLFISS